MDRHVIPLREVKVVSHSSSVVLVPRSDGRSELVAYWFAGSRESGPDVEIVSSRFDETTGGWTDATAVVNRHVLARQLGFGVRRLGNPVAWRDVQGRVHLFAVGTGLGGWAASRVVHLRSDDRGRTFVPLRVLPLSPWFNTSSLVRAGAVSLVDGGALLPVHFELGNRYPVAVRISSRGDPIDVVRMSHDQETLQPTIVPLDEARAIALLRDSSEERTVKVLATADGGQSWTDEGATNLDNPDSSLAAVLMPDGTLIAALNPLSRGRHRLVLAASTMGRDWHTLVVVEDGRENDEFSYPALLVAGDRIHLTYTFKRQKIVHRIYALERP